jgi:hypothetical protein
MSTRRTTTHEGSSTKDSEVSSPHSFSMPAIYDCKDFSKLIKFQQEHFVSGFLENELVILHFSPSLYLSVRQDFQAME